MITIPASISLARNHRAERELIDKARVWIEAGDRAPGWHASDMLNPRLAFFKHVDPKPLPDRLVTIFLVGRVLHGFVLSSMAGIDSFRETDAGSSFSKELGIHYSPDWDKSKIAELKTSRAFRDPDTVGDLDIYVEQLLIYMAAKDTLSAELWVLYLNLRDKNKRTAPVFRAFTVTVDPADLEKLKANVKDIVGRLDTAVAEYDRIGDAGKACLSLPLCREWICGPDQCAYWETCKPAGRYE
jgi:hypothetical protein